MTFFERYFELLDGPDPHSSVELVADDVDFSIQWAADDGSRTSSQFVGDRDELRGLIDAADTEGWAHYVLHSGVSGDVEFALGETRWDTGSASGRSRVSPSSTSRAGCAGTWWRARPCWPSHLSDHPDHVPPVNQS